jgi:hypothetical protein
MHCSLRIMFAAVLAMGVASSPGLAQQTTTTAAPGDTFPQCWRLSSVDPDSVPFSVPVPGPFQLFSDGRSAVGLRNPGQIPRLDTIRMEGPQWHDEAGARVLRTDPLNVLSNYTVVIFDPTNPRSVGTAQGSSDFQGDWRFGIVAERFPCAQQLWRPFG